MAIALNGFLKQLPLYCNLSDLKKFSRGKTDNFDSSWTKNKQGQGHVCFSFWLRVLD